MNDRHKQQPMLKGIRSSKFKHVYGNPVKKELCYDNIKITRNAHDSQFCSVNPKFLAIATESAGGGSFLVIPIEKTGRVEVNYGRVVGHQGPVLDLKWNPFNDNLIASCSDDCTVKIWYIPDEGVSSRGLTDAVVTLCEHKRRVAFVEWHPTADNIILSAGFDHLIYVWALTLSGSTSSQSRGQVVRTISCHPDTIQSMSLNRDGSLLATTCKDKLLRVIDLRKEVVVRSGPGHQGSKSSKVVFLGDMGRLFSTGFSKFSDRQWAVWSIHDLSKPLHLENIDCSSGVLFPFFDNDTRMVYVAGKGDGSIRYYELVDEVPWCFYTSQYITGHPQRGLGVMPKRGLDVHRCEVFRFYKLHATRPLVEPISMIVPRKSQQFQPDIFPDTLAPTPALTAEEWLQGKTRSPILMSLKTGAGAKTHKPFVFKNEDVNNDRKFIFLTQENKVDYRPKTPLTFTNGSVTSPHHISSKVKKFPWSKDEEEENITLCDVVQSKQMPMATFVTLPDNERRHDQPLAINNRHHDLGFVPNNETELREAFLRQSQELNYLRDQINLRDTKIENLESFIEQLTRT